MKKNGNNVTDLVGYGGTKNITNTYYYYDDEGVYKKVETSEQGNVTETTVETTGNVVDEVVGLLNGYIRNQNQTEWLRWAKFNKTFANEESARDYPDLGGYEKLKLVLNLKTKNLGDGGLIEKFIEGYKERIAREKIFTLKRKAVGASEYQEIDYEIAGIKPGELSGQLNIEIKAPPKSAFDKYQYKISLKEGLLFDAARKHAYKISQPNK